jgi:hypothetical protein
MAFFKLFDPAESKLEIPNEGIMQIAILNPF